MSRDHRSTLGILLADAEHLAASVTAHWQALKAAGVTDADRRVLDGARARVKAITEAESKDAASSLEAARETLKDAVGKFRRASWPIANPITGHDRKAEAALRTGGAFPRNDAELKKYVTGLTARLRPYAARLAARGFTKEEQAALAEQARAFLKALAAVGLLKGQAAAKRMQEEKAVEALRLALRYFRGAADAAFHGQPERTDFDRVASPAKPKKAVKPAPAPAGVAAGAAP
jgi:hypothetical protein